MSNLTLDSCLNPVRVRDPHGGFKYFRCGRCSCCQKSKSIDWQYRLFHHLTCGEFVSVFITLTYDNDNLPLVHLNDDFEFDHFESSRVLRCNSIDKVSSRRFISDPFFDVYKFNEFSSRLNSPSIPHFVKYHYGDQLIFDKTNSFAVCYKKDVQDFVKRLRINISRNSDLFGHDPSVSYFICSEYGPKTFRPHYHGILFFRSHTVARWAVKSGVFKSWSRQSLPVDRFGHKIASFISNNSKTAAYVSKYVTCIDHLPSFLGYSEFSTFHLQSISTPIGSLCADFLSVSSMLAKGDICFHLDYFDKKANSEVHIKRPLPSCFWRRFFPKPLNYGSIDSSTLLQLFQRLYFYKDFIELPDHRNFVNAEFDLDKFIAEPVPIYRFYINTDDLFTCYIRRYFPHKLNPESVYRYSFSLPSSGYEFRSVSPSDICRRFLSCLGGVSDYDVFLFGFVHNRCFSKKIISIFKNYHITPHELLRLYQQLSARRFSDHYGLMVDFINFNSNNPNVLNYVYIYEFCSLADIDYYNLICSSFTFYNSIKSNRIYLYNKYLQL